MNAPNEKPMRRIWTRRSLASPAMVCLTFSNSPVLTLMS